MWKEEWLCWFFIFIITLSRTLSKALDLTRLSYYEIVEPHHVGTDGTRRNRRDLSTFVRAKNDHLDETVFTFNGHNRIFNLHLYKNTFLVPDSFNLIYQAADGSYVYTKSVEHCYYHGYLSNRVSSSATVSTCGGLSGVIKDTDGEEFVIEPHPHEDNGNYYGKISSKYVLYNNKDVMNKKDEFECGVKESVRRHDYGSGESNDTHYEYEDESNVQSMLAVITPDEHHRSRRSATGTKYIEVVMVIDNKEYMYYHGKNAAKGIVLTQNRGLLVMNYVDNYYKTMNTRVVITNMIIWNEKNLAPVTSSAHETLSGIQEYTRNVLFGEMKLNFDNAQLMIFTNLWGNLAGLGAVGVICSPSSAAVSRDIGSHYETANTIAHEMGHNIGFGHYKCACTTPPCVMAANKPSSMCKSFAPCTEELYTKKLENGELPCLLEYPEVFFKQPQCGNGLLEAGEQCDCGTEQECGAATACCNFANCTLKADVQCAQGPCCENCMFKPKGAVCRGKLNLDCDVEEECTGTSNNCPDNFYLQDGGPCNNDTSYCYHGMCQTHDSACEFLWGETAKKANDICFNANAENADTWASCGKDDTTGKYVQCTPRNQQCGKLQCDAKSADVSLPRFPVIGSSRGKRTVWISGSGETVACVQGMTAVSPDMGDPTIAGDGIKCANQSICINQICVNLANVSGLVKCDKPCLNGGACTNMGICQCKEGFIPPYCDAPIPATTLAPTPSSSPPLSSSPVQAISASLSLDFSSITFTSFSSLSPTRSLNLISTSFSQPPSSFSSSLYAFSSFSSSLYASSSFSPSLYVSSSLSPSPSTSVSPSSSLSIPPTPSLSPSLSPSSSPSNNVCLGGCLWLLFLLVIPVVLVAVLLYWKRNWVRVKFGNGGKVTPAGQPQTKAHKVDVEMSNGRSGYEDFPENNGRIAVVST